MALVKHSKVLSSSFLPETYLLELNDNNVAMRLKITGHKTGRPSHRITLHQKRLKIRSAKIIKKTKGDGTEFEINRINHLNSFEEVRLHTKELMYPGKYEIDLTYTQPSKTVDQGSSAVFSRDLLPSIDEAESWQQAEVEIKQ